MPRCIPSHRAPSTWSSVVFGTMFFGDPLAAFTNLARATRPGGRIAMVAWQGRATLDSHAGAGGVVMGSAAWLIAARRR